MDDATAAGSGAVRFTDRMARRLAQGDLRVQHRAAISEHPDVRWLPGEWSFTVRIFATAHASERSGSGSATIAPDVGGGWIALRLSFDAQPGQELAFLSYSPGAELWQFVWLVTWRNTLTATAPGWVERRLILTGQPTQFYGEPVGMRVVLTRLDGDSFSLVYEEAGPDDGWLPIDEYRFQRSAAAAPDGVVGDQSFT